jgi:hypothetical protein
MKKKRNNPDRLLSYRRFFEIVKVVLAIIILVLTIITKIKAL